MSDDEKSCTLCGRKMQIKSFMGIRMVLDPSVPDDLEIFADTKGSCYGCYMEAHSE